MRWPDFDSYNRYMLNQRRIALSAVTLCFFSVVGMDSVFVTSVNGPSRMCSFTAGDNCLRNCCALSAIGNWL